VTKPRASDESAAHSAGGSEALLADWRRNLFALTAAVFIGFAGFTLVMPFLPIYIQQMGVQDVGAIAAWTGVSLGVTPAMTALLAPLWGRFADRFGRKIMVARSLISFVILMAAMAYATQPWHIFALRVAQGFFAGYGALVLTMAAESAPPGRMAQSIGLVQTAQRLGPALGPVIGGAVAGAVSLRATFFVTAGFYLVALLLVLAVYVEDPSTRRAVTSDHAATERITFTNVLAFENFVLLLALIFGFQFVDRSLGPVLPLHLTTLGVSDERIALISGIIFTVLACTAALGHHWCAGLLSRWGGRRTLSRASILAAGGAVLMAMASSTPVLGVAVAVFGVGVGVAMTAAYTSAGGALPDPARATGFGFLTSASLIGMAVSPMVAGLIAHAGIRLVFLVDALMLLVFGAAVHRVMEERTRETTGPAMEDA